MAHKAKVLVFAGSLRKDSFNKRLARAAAAAVDNAGGIATFIDLADFALPIFNEDIEKQGTPEVATRLKSIFLANDGLLIASPEYNSSITAALKNAIDWVSRAAAGEKSLAAFSGKVAALVSASPGALGGLRGLVHLRSILGNIQVLVLPEQLAIGQAHTTIAEDGTLQDAKQLATLEAIAAKLVATIEKLK